jgi:hypothetical protein
VRDGAPAKRGRAFKFTDEQAGGFRKQVEGGKSAASLAKELKVSSPPCTTPSSAPAGEDVAGRGRPAGACRARDGMPRKRGRAFKFTDDQAGEFRKQVEGGKSAASLAKELKVSLPTMYNTLKRAAGGAEVTPGCGGERRRRRRSGTAWPAPRPTSV